MGWVTIMVLIVALFLLIWFKGLKFRKGDTQVSVGEEIENKILELKKTVDERENIRTGDEEIRKDLFRESNAIDDRLKADMRRIVRSLNDSIFPVFGPFVKCEFPSVRVVDIIKSELMQRIDENHMRERLRSIEIKGYIEEISEDIRKEYNVFLRTVSATRCGEDYPSWESVADGVSIILINWAERTKNAICARTREKIASYSSARNRFTIEEYRKKSVDDPIEKNRGYLASLEAKL
jgi:hypothetical protein